MPPKKANTEQYKMLVDLVSENDCIRWGKGAPEVKKLAWEEIAIKLNSIGGVEKSGDGWKKAFTEFKSHIKLKIRTTKALNETEKKCAEMSGLFACCSGLSVPELGMNNNIVNEEENVAEEHESESADHEDEELYLTEDTGELQRPRTAPENVAPPKKKTVRQTQAIRKQKTTLGQYELYLQFKKLEHTNEAFENLCRQLNNEKNAPIRSTANWKRIFSEWETKVKAKARRIHFEQEITGGGIPVIEILSNLEKKLLQILSKILIYGHPDVIELGFKQKKYLHEGCTYKIKSKNIRKKYKKKIVECFELNPILLTELKRNLNCIIISMSNLNKALQSLMEAHKKI